MNTKLKTKHLVTLGLFCAIAYMCVLIFRIPVVQWLKYEPKDTVIVMAGFLFGPMATVLVSVVVSVLEFATISDTGLWGLLMNVVSTCSFAFTASCIYKYHRTQKGAYISLFSGYVLMVIIMILWNYLVTPFYMGVPRGQVAKMLIPVFLPFNAVKGALNVALTLLLYKPLMKGLQAAGLIEKKQNSLSKKGLSAIWSIDSLGIAFLLIVTSVLLILVVKGVI